MDNTIKMGISGKKKKWSIKLCMYMFEVFYFFLKICSKLLLYMFTNMLTIWSLTGQNKSAIYNCNSTEQQLIYYLNLDI